MSTIHLNIGSNLGNRRALLGRAAALLARVLAPCRMSLSGYVESEPWGYDSPNPFLNRGIRVDTMREMAPADVLAATQAVERAIGHGAPHRAADGSYCDRPIDIDVIDIDSLVLDTPSLTLPHPRMHLRMFVLGPLSELDPGWRHPVTGLSVGELIEALEV